MLTARELLNTQFDQVFRGYNVSQVDAFLTRLVGEYETLMQENKALKKGALQTEVAASADFQIIADQTAADQTAADQVSQAQAQLIELEQEIKTAQLELRLIEDEKAELYHQLKGLLQTFSTLVAQCEPGSSVAEPAMTATAIAQGED